MAISLQNILARHEQRLRLVFTNTLGTGAFTTSPTFYVVENLDGRGVSPGILASLQVTGSPSVVELVLDSPLALGALYRVTATGTPATDLSVVGTEAESFRFGSGGQMDREPSATLREELLYGVDLLWTGVDYAENDLGDLDRVGGTANVAKALYRGALSNGLPYAPEWGVKARGYVDSPQGTSGSLKGSFEAQVLRDPRVQSVRVVIEVTGAATYLHAYPKLLSGEDLKHVTLTVPSAS